jgi:hypothetical protein
MVVFSNLWPMDLHLREQKNRPLLHRDKAVRVLVICFSHMAHGFIVAVREAAWKHGKEQYFDNCLSSLCFGV